MFRWLENISGTNHQAKWQEMLWQIIRSKIRRYAGLRESPAITIFTCKKIRYSNLNKKSNITFSVVGLLQKNNTPYTGVVCFSPIVPPALKAYISYFNMRSIKLLFLPSRVSVHFRRRCVRWPCALICGTRRVETKVSNYVKRFLAYDGFCSIWYW